MEWRIRREQNLIGTKEIQSAPQCRKRTKRGRIGVKHLEIFLRPLLEFPAHHGQILLLGTCPQLVESGTGSSGKVRNHGAQVVRDNLQAGEAVKISGKQNTSHGHRSFIRPPKYPPQFEL